VAGQQPGGLRAWISASKALRARPQSPTIRIGHRVDAGDGSYHVRRPVSWWAGSVPPVVLVVAGGDRLAGRHGLVAPARPELEAAAWAR
jgi:hypothetical protein